MRTPEANRGPLELDEVSCSCKHERPVAGHPVRNPDVGLPNNEPGNGCGDLRSLIPCGGRFGHSWAGSSLLEWGMAATDVLTEILRLPAEQRAKLALELIRSLDDESDADAAAAWDEEIERRAAEVEAGTAETITIEEYRAHVRARRAARATQ